MLTLAIPIVLQNLISIGLNMADTVMIGKLGVDELAAVGTGFCILAALAALNVPALLACLLLENALLGLWFALECKKGRPGAGTPERPRR